MAAVVRQTRLSSMTFSKTLDVGPVRNGQGIIALKSFAPGATICRIKGRIISAKTVWRYWDIDRRRAENCFRYDADHYLDPEGEIGAYANHSCNPNAHILRTARGMYLRALKAIAAGREVTHDYSTLLGADDEWTMRCDCGFANCRGIVSSLSTLPPKLLRRYKRLGIIPSFMFSI